MPKYHGKYHYLGAWGYVLLDILYCIPVVGLICLLIHAFSDKNENRRHYARSYFVRILLILIVCAITAGVAFLTLGSEGVSAKLTEIQERWDSFSNPSASAPLIITQPKSASVSAGDTVSFNVAASGTDLTYQWYFLKPGETNWKIASNNGTSSTYTLTAESRHNGYSYFCTVTNTVGSVSTYAVTLTVK